MIAPARHLDPLRIVHGTRGERYDCPDPAIVDRHILRLRRRIATSGDSTHLRNSHAASAFRELSGIPQLQEPVRPVPPGIVVTAPLPLT